MNRREFSEFRDKHYAEIAAINDAKGKDYAGDEDALANFKAAARDLGLTPFQVWSVYHHKHQSAIDSFIREGKVESEPIEGRIHDAILYLFLLLGLIEDGDTRPMGVRMPSLGPDPDDRR
jgi:hypothetical protein